MTARIVRFCPSQAIQVDTRVQEGGSEEIVGRLLPGLAASQWTQCKSLERAKAEDRIRVEDETDFDSGGPMMRPG